MTLVLIVDDVVAMAEQYAYDLKRVGGFDTMVATGGTEGLAMIESEPVDCVILDLEMPGVDGFKVLSEMKAREIRIPVIVYTGTGSYDRCVKAIKLGAYSFIDKAESMERVTWEVERALEHEKLRGEVERLRRGEGICGRMEGSSGVMKSLSEQISRLAAIPSPVLVTGESGTGKELVARELHNRGPGEKRPFVAVNSAAFPENLIESELFGHERGAFTGASRMHRGAFERAAGGTIFLDEIGELPLPAQAKLLRVLEQRELTRIGGERAIKVDARVVAATNRDLEAEVEEGRFRQDLFYRLNVHMLHVPPLRDRKSDIPGLAKFFISRICAQLGKREKAISPEALDKLMDFDWTRNNVRELRNVIERMIIASDSDTMGTEHLPPDILAGEAVGSGRTFSARGEGSDDALTTGGAGRMAGGLDAGRGSLKDLKAEAERRIIVAALERNGWQITNTARELGLADHASLLKIMRRHNLKRK